MVYRFAKQDGEISDEALEKSIRRNFNGLDDLDPLEIFGQQFKRLNRHVKVKLFWGRRACAIVATN